jgi:hypothetical protein
MKITREYLKQIIKEELSSLEEDALSDREKAASISSTASKYNLSLSDASTADEVDRTLTSLAVDKSNLTPDEMADVAAKKGLASNKNILDKMTSAAGTQSPSTTPSAATVKVPLSLRRLRTKQ